jgi:hypothetical protein
MNRARHPKEYKKGKSQVTLPWKRRVLSRLAENKRANKTPANREQLNDAVAAPKGSVNGLLDLDRDPPQLTSAYADEISELLQIAPPLLEEDGDDEEFVRDVMFLRTLTRDERRDLLQVASRISKRNT